MTPGPSMDRMPAQPAMRGGFAFSVGVHALILALIIFGLPYFHRKATDLPPMISVELVEIGKETTTNKISDANKIEKQPEEEKPAPPPPPVTQPTPPQPQPQPEPQPRPQIDAAPQIQAVDNSVPELKTPDVVLTKPLQDAPKLAAVDDKVAALMPPAKVDLKRPPPKPPAESFNSVLKNLTKAVPQQLTEQPPTPQAKTPAKPATGAQAMVSNKLTSSENDALMRQLSQCWSMPASAKDAQDLVVTVEVVVNPDRTVSAVHVVDQSRVASDPAFRAAAMSAQRAFRMQQCTPLDLPPDKYQDWQDLEVTFNPKEMLGQ